MVSVTRRGNTFKALAAIAVAALALGLGSSANAQIHGVQIGKNCDSPRCVLDTTDCLILIGHADGFGDTIRINDAYDIIQQDAPDPDIRVPAVGNLPIVSIEGNAYCSGGACDQSTGAGCSLPCFVGPANSTLSGLPGDPQAGIIRFRSATYVIQPDDPNPLQDQATVEVTDLCDSPTTSGCSNVENAVQFTASTLWCDEDDGNACTVDTCVDGNCTNTPRDCNDNNACTTDTCDPATGCVNTPITCNDNSLCTTDTCNPAIGCVFTPIVCTDSNNCTTDTCNPQTGCVFTPNPPCNDNSLCTTDACVPTAPGNGCVFTPIPPCNDNSVCTTDTCVPAVGCVFTPIPPCTDNNNCTSDRCDPVLGCVFTPNAPCNDNNLCTTDACVPTAPGNGCVFTPIAPCNDNNACTTDTCVPTVGCVFTPNQPCNDFNFCTTDTCDPVLGCVFTPNPPCNDNNLCTTDACVPAIGCVFTPIPLSNCNDNNPCTTDICDPLIGCDNIPQCTVDADCPDETPFPNLCTEETCAPTGCCVRTEITCPPPGGTCQFSECNPATGLCEISGVNCNDGNECTEDICDPITGCRFEPIACCEPVCEPVTKAHFDIWNENERKLSGTYRCIASWDQELLSRYTPNGLANNLLRPNLQTDKGKARIDGLRSQQCEENCFRDPKSGEPLPIEAIIDLFGEEVDVVCSEDNPLLGVAAKVITFSPTESARAGSELVGMGHQAGQIAYDLLGGSPPTAAAGVVSPDNFVKSIRSSTRAGESTLLEPEQSIGRAAGLDDPPIPVGIGRGSTTQKGSLVVYTKVEIKWDAAGNVIQDTFLTLTNDYFEEVTVQLYFVHGEVCTWVDNAFILTPNQSVYWSVLTGQPIGASPFTVLEERCPDDDPENPGGTRMRGYVLAWAVDQTTNREIRFNHLSGNAMLLNYRDVTAWEYNAWAFQASEAVAHGAVLFPPYGRLDVNGVEYQSAPDQLLLDFFASGAMINPGGAGAVSIDTDLTLWIFDADLRENTGDPFENDE